MTRIGDGLSLVLTIALFGMVFWIFWRPKRSRQPLEPVPDDPSQPYTVFTCEYDLEVVGSEIERRLIGASPDYQSGLLKLGKDQWRAEVKLAGELLEREGEAFQKNVGDLSALKGAAVTILVDQSGSMRDEPIRWAAVSSRLAAEVLGRHECKVEILGFSTAGWRGGFAYQKWKLCKRPWRPGRLCALLHVIYKSEGEGELSKVNWEAMLNPNALRENVDGEALDWAARRLRGIQSNRKYLIVLSDGAPVDDATLMHNGLNYLARHAKEVITQIEGQSEINLSAIGIRYAVDEYYSRSIRVEEVSTLPQAMANWLSRMAGGTI